MSATLDTLLTQFLKERKYRRNVSPQTIEWYETAWTAFRKCATPSATCPGDLRQAHLEGFVYVSRDRGVRPVTVNTWLKALNTFFGWLHERGDLPTKIRLKPLKVEKRLVPTIDADAIRTIVTYKPPMWVTLNKKHGRSTTCRRSLGCGESGSIGCGIPSQRNICGAEEMSCAFRAPWPYQITTTMRICTS